MGQTLTHGVYLPSEGERNCYNGLAANWAILDGAVGTVAAHTSALAGKAPLVHTHTKADITDLFNSANTWSGDNTFSGSNSFNSGLTINNAALLNAVLQNAVKGDVSTTGDFAIFIKDKVNSNAATSLLAVYRGGQDNRGSYAQINVDTKGNDNNRYNNGIILRINPADNSNNAVLIPQRDKTIDLGTSTNSFKTLNGINPGALSLPNGNAQDSSWIGDLTIKDGSGYNLKTFTLNGWITINIPNTAGNLIVVNNGCGQIVTNEANGITGNNCAVFIPVVANVQISILLVLQTGESVKTAIFAPCLGNV